MISFKGRLSRKSFFIKSVVVGLVQLLNVIVMSYVQKTLTAGADTETSLLSLPISLASMVISISVVVFSVSISIKRWHDLGKSGWWTLITLVPVVNSIVWLYLILKKGEATNNNYGSPQA